MIAEFMEIYLVTTRATSTLNFVWCNRFHETPISAHAIFNYMPGASSASSPHSCEEIYLTKLIWTR